VSFAEGAEAGIPDNAEQWESDVDDRSGRGAVRTRQPVKERQPYQQEVMKKYGERRSDLVCESGNKKGNIGPNGIQNGKLLFKCKCKKTCTERAMMDLLGLELKRRGNTLYVVAKTVRRP